MTERRTTPGTADLHPDGLAPPSKINRDRHQEWDTGGLLERAFAAEAPLLAILGGRAGDNTAAPVISDRQLLQ